MSYEYNPDKPEALLINYTSVRGAELKAIYNLLEIQGDVPVQALEDRYGCPQTDGTTNTDHVENCLKFLRTIDMIDISGQNVVSELNEDIYPELPIEAKILHHLRQQTGEGYHLSYIFDVMTKQNQRRILSEILLEEVDDDDEREFGLQWNSEKLRMWANLSGTLGAISYITDKDENEIMTSPARAVMYDLLEWYNKNGESPERFVRALEWIDEEFLPVFSSRPGRPEVAVGVADVLRNMEEEGVIELTSMSDTENVADLPRRKGGTVPVATFSVNNCPNRATYRYPLDRSERRVHA